MRGQFLVQMAGTSAAGKSTLAAAIGRATGAVVIDKDIIKGGMLDGGVPEEIAGPTAYEVFFDLGCSLLAQGFSVVMDSPANFTRIRKWGAQAAASAGACYYIIRCVLGDLDELQRRMDTRAVRSSQPVVAALENYHRPGTSPLTEPHFVIDMSRPLDVSLKRALDYVGRPVPDLVAARHGQG